MEIDLRRKLIIGALDPRHDDVDQASCPGIGTLGSKNRNPNCRSGFFIISYADPTNLQADRGLRRRAGRPHHELRRRLQLRVDRRPRAPQRPRLPRAVHARRPRRRPPDLGDQHQAPGARRDVLEADRPEPQRRRDRLLARRRRRRQRDRVGQRPRRPARLRDARQAGATRDRHGPRRRTPWDPVLVAGGGLPGGDNGVAQPQTDFIHNAARPLNGSVHAAGVRRRQHRADDRGGLHGALRPGRPDRRRGHHELARRRGRHELDARAPVPDDRARLVPPRAQPRPTRCRRTRRARRTTSRCPARRSPPPGTARACA